MNTLPRARAHQEAVLLRRQSNAARWERLPKGQRTRADRDNAAKRDQEAGA